MPSQPADRRVTVDGWINVDERVRVDKREKDIEKKVTLKAGLERRKALICFGLQRTTKLHASEVLVLALSVIADTSSCFILA